MCINQGLIFFCKYILQKKVISNLLHIIKEQNDRINVLEDNEIREGIKAFSDWPTIPQLYIKKEFIGGCDIVKEMFEKKELQKKLSEKEIPYKN